MFFTGRPGSSPFTVPENQKHRARKMLKERQEENRNAAHNQSRYGF